MRFFVFSVFLALQGCVGVQFIHDKTAHVESPNGTYVLVERGQYIQGSGLPVRTKEDVRGRWGEPDAIWLDGEAEKWRYNKNISWIVIVPQLIIPIPLGIPVGHSSVTITFHGSKIVSVDADQTDSFGLGCGYYVLAAGCMTGRTFHGVIFFHQGS